MSLQKIIATAFVVLVFLSFTLGGTYFAKKDIVKSAKGSFLTNTGIYEIISTPKGFSYSKLEDSNPQDGRFYIDRFNNIDKVYFVGKNYSRKNINGIDTFFIGNGGLYVFDLYDLVNEFIIDGYAFKINPKSPGKFFIDNRNSEDIRMFSFDSIFSVSLFDRGKEVTSIFVYPHMYFGFNASRNRSLKNADLLRIEMISDISYIPKNLLLSNNKVNYLFLNQIYPKKDDVSLSFLTSFFDIAYSKDEIDKYSELPANLVESSRIGGLDHIDRYPFLFLNHKKKVAYYKKNILDNLNNLFKKDGNFDKNRVLFFLDGLKKLDQKEYDDFKRVLYHYYENLLKINSIDYIDKVFVFTEILGHGSKSLRSLPKSSFYLNKIYSLVNNRTYSSDYLQANLLEFLKYYLEENRIEVSSQYDIKIKDKNVLGRIDYLLFFIKNVLIYNLNLADNKNLKNIFSILKIYNNLSININALKNYEKSETLVVENSLLIDKILYEMRKNFFEKDLNQAGLLVLSRDNEISSKDVEVLDEVMKMFFNFYNSKKGVLSEKNQIYNDIYAKNIATYGQFYDALNNYPEYLIKYDKTSSSLLQAKTVLESTGGISLSKENLVSYLSNFDGVDLSNVLFEIVDNSYYKINNLNILGETFSFDLYPNEFNRISNIARNGQKLTLSYELDNIKRDWEERYKQELSEENKSKYDFKKFFVNVFFSSNTTQKKDFVLDEESTETEDRVISIFKRDKLLGDRGEFSLIKDYLELKYKNVKVNLINGAYDIRLEDTLLRTRIDLNGEPTEVICLLNASYVFSDKDHYFKNISFKFYDVNRYNNGEKEFMFNGKTFRVEKNINIIDFKSEMDRILKQYLLSEYKNG